MNLIGQTEINFAIALAFSVFSGVVVGIERESRSKDAGIGTHVLVITGSLLFTFLSAIADPESKSRIAAQVVSGIGFLGAGLIIRDGVSIKNLTTAASLWVAASIGMAYGYSYYLIGVMVTLILVFAPRIPHLRKKIFEKTKGGPGRVDHDLDD